MIGAFLCLLAIATTYMLGRRALGHGLGATLAWGYFYGIVRANVPDGASHFIFDSALVGLYASAFLGRGAARPTAAKPWVSALMVWPILMALVPYNHLLVQLVGLRSAIFFLPLVLLGAWAKERDLDLVAQWLVRLNLLAFTFGAAEFVLGIERFYPHNAVTDIIYRSSDVGLDRHHRIPAIFPNAHAYGGTMVATLPLIARRLGRLGPGRERSLMIAATVAAVLGVFLCAARLPALGLFVVGVTLIFVSPLARRAKLGFAGLGLVIGLLVAQSERLQRFSSLSDTDAVASRVHGSLNLNLIDIILDYPAGAGLGSAVGTSMPYFLLDLVPVQIGMESEYGRISLEQSIIGLGLWLAFVGATLLRRSRSTEDRSWRVMVSTTRAFVAFTWLSAFIGTGLLTSVPGTVLLLVGMGLLWNDQRPVRARAPMRPVAAPARAR